MELHLPKDSSASAAIQRGMWYLLSHVSHIAEIGPEFTIPYSPFPSMAKTIHLIQFLCKHSQGIAVSLLLHHPDVLLRKFNGF